MLVKIKLVLQVPEEVKFNVNMSSLLHGYLMEMISSEFSEEMHVSKLKPFSQSLVFENGEWVWYVSVLNKCAKEEIIDKLVNVDKIYLKHKGLIIEIKEKKLINTTYNELIENNYFVSKPSRFVEIQFLTPTAFKQDGSYVNYPDLRLVFQSLIRKYDAHSLSTSLYEEKLVEELLRNLEIIKYNLRSTVFHIEGVKIPSFIGRITIKVYGSESFRNMINMLAEFGQYSGVGIKAAIGMGAIKRIEKRSEPI